MRKPGSRGMLHFAVMISAIAMLAGCSHTGAAMQWSAADTPPPGYRFSNGMPPSSDGPPPAWYAQRFNRERGLGEAIKQNRRALWERGPGTFAYFVGGRFFAQYQPWEHYLQIRTDYKEQSNLSCHWDANGALTISEADGGAAPAGAGATCNQLLDELQSYLSPAGMTTPPSS